MALRIALDGAGILLTMTGRSKTMTSSVTAAEARDLGRHLYALAEHIDPPNTSLTVGKVIACDTRGSQKTTSGA